MKKFLALTVFAALLFAVSCGGSGESKKVVEEKSQTITASEGGEIEVAGGEAKIKIPAGALDKDTEISVTLYTTDGFKNKKALASNVVEFGPSGTKFKKPVIITINTEKAIKGKTVAAAVMKSDGSWSYSEKGAYAVLDGFDEAGDPIMTTAAGDPIMISNGNLTTAAGDPIMNAAAGDPIMLASAGDPIMTNAAGDPIMNAAAGDPIMMTTGHFSDYTFIVVNDVEEENNTTNPGNQHSGEITCKTIQEWDTLYGDAEDTDYDNKEDDSIYCLETGEMLVYCIEGAFAGTSTSLYSIKAGDKEFKCSGNNSDCYFEMEQYCGALEGEYIDGYYCVEDGECKNNGEMIKSCTSVKEEDDYKVYYQTGDKKFECTRDNLEECYDEVYEYCGSIEEIDDPGEKIDEDVPEECEYYMFCDTGDFNIYLCTPEEGDTYIFYSGYKQECVEPEEGMDMCEQELNDFAESCSY